MIENMSEEQKSDIATEDGDRIHDRLKFDMIFRPNVEDQEENLIGNSVEDHMVENMPEEQQSDIATKDGKVGAEGHKSLRGEIWLLGELKRRISNIGNEIEREKAPMCQRLKERVKMMKDLKEWTKQDEGFERTRIHQRNQEDANLYVGAHFFALLTIMLNDVAELQFTLNRLPVFFIQRFLLLYPAWDFSIPSLFLSILILVVETFVWVVMIYYGIGFAPAAESFTVLFSYFNPAQVENSELARVAAVSAGNNHEVGNMIAGAMSKLLSADKKITNARDLIGILEDAILAGYPMIIIAEDIEQEVLVTLFVNRLRGAFKIAALKVPSLEMKCSRPLTNLGMRFWVRRQRFVKIISNTSTVIRDEVEPTLDKFGNEVLGTAAKIISNTCTVIRDEVEPALDKFGNEVMGTAAK
ncbi:hypothetical protein KI387_029621, partial [Taxus chinensis]